MYDPFRNYDAWKTASPFDEDLHDDTILRCSCGAFLSHTPTRKETRQHVDKEISDTRPRNCKSIFDVQRIDSPWEDEAKWWSYKIRYEITVAIHRCKRCGKNTEIGDW